METKSGDAVYMEGLETERRDLKRGLAWALRMIERAGDLTWTTEDKALYWQLKNAGYGRFPEAEHKAG